MNKKINLVYFSCQRDIELLKYSIRSSKKNYKFNKIFVFSDPNDPCDPTGFGKDINFIQRDQGSKKLYGLSNIQDMINCFKIASADCDFILKKDSDILDASTYAYDELNKNSFLCYGGFPWAREELIPKNHFNGNAYFIHADIIRQLAMPANSCEIGEWAWLNYPEDMIISNLCSKITQNIKIDKNSVQGGKYVADAWLHYISDPNNYGFIHCRSNFGIMEFYYKQIYDKIN